MTREQLNALCDAIRAMKARADRLERIKSRITELRDAAKLQTTKAIYQAILDLFEEDDD